MPSFRGRISMVLVRIIVKHWPKDDSAALVRRARRVFGEPKLVRFRLPQGLKIEPVDAEIQGEWLIPEQLRFPHSVLLYFHGGGYVSCSAKGHRAITATLARMMACRVFSADYRLAPEHPSQPLLMMLSRAITGSWSRASNLRTLLWREIPQAGDWSSLLWCSCGIRGRRCRLVPLDSRPGST